MAHQAGHVAVSRKTQVPQSPLSRKESPDDEEDNSERRQAADRRRSTFHALMYGSFHPRRLKPRRDSQPQLAAVDWHQPHWLAVAVLILLLSCADAFLTLMLLNRGAYEVNPLMAPLVNGSPLVFTLVKISLTAAGVVLLTILARMRVFRGIPISFLLYAVLAGYAVLVIYEMKLLEETFLTA